MTDIYEEIIRIKDEGEEAALVTISSTSGSTPREEGAKMLVRADGSLEAQVCQKAIEVIRMGKPQRFHFRLKEGEERGMICGGDLLVVSIKSSPPPA